MFRLEPDSHAVSGVDANTVFLGVNNSHINITADARILFALIPQIWVSKTRICSAGRIFYSQSINCIFFSVNQTIFFFFFFKVFSVLR